MKYITRITQFTVVPEGKPIYNEMATEVTLDDECGGEFVKVTQHVEDGGSIKIEPEEWPTLRDAINDMIAFCVKKEGK